MANSRASYVKCTLDSNDSLEKDLDSMAEKIADKIHRFVIGAMLLKDQIEYKGGDGISNSLEAAFNAATAFLNEKATALANAVKISEDQRELDEQRTIELTNEIHSKFQKIKERHEEMVQNLKFVKDITDKWKEFKDVLHPAEEGEGSESGKKQSDAIRASRRENTAPENNAPVFYVPAAHAGLYGM